MKAAVGDALRRQVATLAHAVDGALVRAGDPRTAARAAAQASSCHPTATRAKPQYPAIDLGSFATWVIVARGLLSPFRLTRSLPTPPAVSDWLDILINGDRNYAAA